MNNLIIIASLDVSYTRWKKVNILQQMDLATLKLRICCFWIIVNPLFIIYCGRLKGCQ